MKKSILLLPFVTTLFLGCQKGEKTITTTTTTTDTSQVSVGTPISLRFGIQGDVFSLDPGKSADTITDEVLFQCCEGLMQRDEKGNVVPNLAEKVETSNDGKKYTFHIKKGIKFHNGDELTAQDFKWTFERNLNKQFNSTTAISIFKNIVGAEEYYAGKALEIKGVKILNPYLLEIQTIHSQNHFLYNLASTTACVLNHKVVPQTEIKNIKNIVGTGAYLFVEWEKNQYMRFTTYQNYHGQKPQLKDLEYFIIEDHTAMLNKIRKGHLDIAVVAAADAKIARTEPGIKEGLQEFLTNNIYFLELNYLKDPSLTNPKIRRAIAHAINQEELVEEGLENTALAAHYIIPKGVLGYRSGKGTVEFNVEKAKQLFNETKIDPNKFSFKITVSAKSPLGNKVAENVTVQLRKNLGIKAEVHKLAADIHHAKGRKKELIVRFGGSTTEYPDPSCILDPLFSSKSPSNHTYYSNLAFDQLAKKAELTTNLEQRATLYQKAEDILLTDVVVIPLFMPKGFYWINPKIKNVRYNSMGCLPHNKVIVQ